MKRVVIIGGGVGGLAAACLLGKSGYAVTVLEKNEQVGGRCGSFEAKAFRFDTGPSWFLMPEVFEQFFADLDENIGDYLQFDRLSPNFRVFYKDQKRHLDIYGDIARDAAQFEKFEPGAGQALRRYLAEAERVYQVSLAQFLPRNYNSRFELFGLSALRAGLRPQHLLSLHHEVARQFTDLRLQQILEFPAMFLGGSPFRTPALYGLLSHAIMNQPIISPRGGMYRLIDALVAIGHKHGVRYKTNTEVTNIIVKDGQAAGVMTAERVVPADLVISDAGVQFTEQRLLGAPWRDHSPRYWRGRTLAPSAVLLFLGINRQYASLAHHNLLFSPKWSQNFAQIFGPCACLPSDPSLYVCAPCKTDSSAAPKGHENLFVLVPVAAGGRFAQPELDGFAAKIIQTLEQEMQLPDLRRHIVHQAVFAAQDFATTFNTRGGSGLGLAHTISQSAAFRPRNSSRRVSNLFYVGADVHPGIGLPTCLISAQLCLQRITQKGI